MKTDKELNELSIECEFLNRKLAELADDELEQVTGGVRDEDTIEIPESDEKRVQKIWLQ